MKWITALLLVQFLFTHLPAQTNNEKIKVILLGTFHYGFTSDRNKITFPDLFSKKRQAELDSIAAKLTAFGVTKFFVETPVEKQLKLDSLFAAYKSKTLTDTNILRDEEIQIAYRTAVINNAKLIASDSRQDLPYEAMDAYEKAHKNDTVNPYQFFDVKYPFTEKRKKLNELSLFKYYIQLNNAYSRQAILFDYLHYALSYGNGKDYTGENFTLSWYDRNLKIFTNILRDINIAQDKVIVVLYGSSHTAILRQFFQNHPYFKIVEVEEVFK